MHILLLTKIDDQQMADLAEVVAENPKARLSRDQKSARESGQPVTAIIGSPPPDMLEHLHQLDWVQLRTDCLESWEKCLRVLHQKEVRVTRTRGSYNDTVPDHCLMMLLAFARDLPQLLTQGRAHAWTTEKLHPTILSEATVGIIGMGSIGSAVAERALAFGLRVIGVDPAPSAVPAGVQKVVTPDHLDEVLAESDFVVITVPATSETIGMIDAEALAAMKPGAVLLNVGRGSVIDTEALLEALDDGRLGGAGLDVVEPSPLPEDHPLWDHPRVLLTCHSAQKGSNFAAAQFAQIRENIRRYVHDEPLLNQVAPQDWM